MPHTIRAWNAPADPHDFSLAEGGLFFRILQWARLSDGVLAHVRRRILVITLLAWLPLLMLSAVAGNVFGRVATVPFLSDVDVHVRVLVALPLLILAEVEMHHRLPPLLCQFLDRGLIPESARTRFDAALASQIRLRNSALPELILVGCVYGFGILILWRQYLSIDAATWYATPAGEGTRLTLAGMWYAIVSLPITQFLLLRWYWRLLLWARFLWQVSRIRLSLLPAHPDRAAGLGFLATTSYAFVMLAVAHGALAAGQIASHIFFAGADLYDFADAVLALVVFMLGLVFGPLLFFAPQMADAKLDGLIRYGALGEHYVREFDRKWLDGQRPADETLVGSADIQSLADLSNSYEVVGTMRLAPITHRAALWLASATLLPIAPLLLTAVPLDALLKQLLGIAV